MVAASLALGVLLVPDVAQAAEKKWSKVKIAMEGAFPPYNLLDSSNKMIGFEPDLILDMCARMKLQCEIIVADWDSLIPGLKAGKFDLALDGMSITEERKKEVAFVGPYASVPNGFGGAKNGPLAKLGHRTIDLSKDPKAGAAAFEELQRALKGKVIGVQVATTHATVAHKYFDKIAEVREYKTSLDRHADLVSGRLDVELDSLPTIKELLTKPDSQHLQQLGADFTGGDFGVGIGIAMRKTDAELKALLERTLKAMMADGALKKHSLKWFGINTAP